MTTPSRNDLTIENVRPWGGPLSDVVIRQGAVETVTPVSERAAPEPSPGTGTMDGRGRIIIPSFTDAHVHLDSTRLGLPYRPNSADGTLYGQIMNDRQNWRDAGATVGERATFALERAIAKGMTRARSYAQIDTDCGLERFDGVMLAREKHRNHASIQVIAFPQSGIVRDPGTAELLHRALADGADAIGGIDPCGLDRDPKSHLDVVFDLAERHSVPIDIHLHERAELGLFTIDLILERIRALDMKGRVTLSHAFALGGLSSDVRDPLLEKLAEWDVSLTTIAPSSATALPLAELVSRGVRIGLGQDGQRDYWSPFGNADMLHRTWQLAFTNGFRRDDLIEHCVAVATVGGASVIDPRVPRLTSILDRPGIAGGDRADFVILDGETVASAVMDQLPDRTVIHDGEVVADGLHLSPIS